MSRALPMRVLVVNCGSSSLKFRLLDADDWSDVAAGSLERIGEPIGVYKLRIGRDERPAEEFAAPSHAAAAGRLADDLASAGLLPPGAGPDAVVHRVVHGGEEFSAATLLDDDAIARIERLAPLAPLHNPANLVGVRAMRARFPQAPHVAVFDTAFHQTMPPRAFRYALPERLYREAGVRRYGFHGASHRWASRRAAELLGRPLEELKTVVLHLGAGASAAAIDRGRSIDTSMGMTPLEGLVMATRSGDLDPGVVLHLQRATGAGPDDVDRLLNRESGLVGLAGGGDLRDVLAAAERGDERAGVALEVYAYRAAKQVGAYAVALRGLDAMVFTAGVGEHSPAMRRRIADWLGVLGVELDDAKNGAPSRLDRAIQAPSSRVAVCVVAANEERQMAEEAVALIGRGN